MRRWSLLVYCSLFVIVDSNKKVQFLILSDVVLFFILIYDFSDFASWQTEIAGGCFDAFTCAHKVSDYCDRVVLRVVLRGCFGHLNYLIVFCLISLD